MRLMTLGLSMIASAWGARGVSRLGAIFIITAAFSLLGYAVRGVTRGGALAVAAVCFALFASAGPGGFIALLTVFGLTWVATRVGLARKQRMGTAEGSEGRRASQVMANLGVSGLCAVLYGCWGDPRWLIPMTAALSEAAADTVSSECGQALRTQARLITTLERVPAGTNGGITVAGSLCGAVAAFVVGLVCAIAGLLSWKGMLVASVAGTFGMFADSFLGALLERRGWIGNDAVNLLGTAAAALLAISCAVWFG